MIFIETTIHVLHKTSAPIGALQVKLSALLGNYDRPMNRPTDQRTEQPTNRRDHREVSLPTIIYLNTLSYKLPMSIIADPCRFLSNIMLVIAYPFDHLIYGSLKVN